MNKRNIVHINGFVGCICNFSETGFGNQMKESEASERKKTQTRSRCLERFSYVCLQCQRLKLR